MSNVHRKHPVSIAVSMALLAAAATSAMASEGTDAPAQNAGAQSPAQEDVPTPTTAVEHNIVSQPISTLNPPPAECVPAGTLKVSSPAVRPW